MQVLERIWEFLGVIFSGLAGAFERGLTSLFGSSNARYLKRLQQRVNSINALEPKYQAMSEDELRQQTVEFRKRLAAGETLDNLLVEAFAVCREGGRRFLGMRHYDVQMMGGMVLHSGAIAEMVTGEGKTLVATLPAYLNALEGKGVHVVTVNDYLARRDMEWMGPLYMGLGLTVGAIFSNMEPHEKQHAYSCDITYGTNNEFGFDYLRDNMRMAARDDNRFRKQEQQVQGRLNYAIIDEVDNILIDEARTPLIIAGPSEDDVTRYAKADKIARQLRRDEHFEVKEKEHSAHLTDDGVREAERLAGVESFYTAGHMEWPHLIDNSLKAHHLYKRDVNYVVQEDEIIIVDEFTGRLMQGRTWSDGLHQAVEAKEGVKVKSENQTYATITLQNFFKLYNKISGMTGTAMTEASEFWKIYQLDVVAMPTNRGMQRKNHPDVIYRSEREKFEAIIDEIERLNKYQTVELSDGTAVVGKIVKEQDDKLEIQPKDQRELQVIDRAKVRNINQPGRPVLVGTVSIEKSERLSSMLERRGIKHEVLNAKHHQREAEIISQAGRMNAVTIATNMAGRGTDIVLGGNPETKAWAILQEKYPTRLDVPQDEWNALVHEIEQRDQMKAQGQVVKDLGGLHIVGTERHEARRIDLQLRGRCGRQGDPGSSRFFLSLEDDLMRIFAGDWVKNVMTKLGMQEGEAIESSFISRRIEGAQKKVEERNFDVRKNLLEYDEVMDEQRKRVYGFRQSILEGENCKQKILEMVQRQIAQRMNEFLDKDYGNESFAKAVGNTFGVEFEGREFRGLDFDAAVAHAKDEAERKAESQVFDAVEENLPNDVEEDEWNWSALADMANARWGTKLRDRDLKAAGRDGVAELLLTSARQAIEQIDLGFAKEYLEEDYGVREACSWAKVKFDLVVQPEELKGLDIAAAKKLILDRVEQNYEERETAFPVLTGLGRFSQRDAHGNRRYDREALVAWARARFDLELNLDEMRGKPSEEIQKVLIDSSKLHQLEATKVLADARQQVTKIFGENGKPDRTLGMATGGNGALNSLADWLKKNLGYEVPTEELAELDREELERRLASAVEDRFHPEMRRMERFVILETLDKAWKEHLLTMDHLRSSVGLRGYAQVDPKVEYKREGMRLFEEMWTNEEELVTTRIFHLEQADDNMSASTWIDSEAVHESPPPPSPLDDARQQAINNSESDAKHEPIRNFQQKVGRNEPCPCGSGKKFKNCHMRTDG